MENEMVVKEIKRIMEEIDKFQSENDQNIILKEMSFDQRILIEVDSMCLRLIIGNFNEIIDYLNLSEKPRKNKIDCLNCYKNLFIKMIE